MFRKKMVMVTGILTAASILAGCAAAGSSTGESASSSGSAQSETQSQSDAMAESGKYASIFQPFYEKSVSVNRPA
ncbi:MAG: hypothetical protein SOU32_03915 [Lachnospiraceae bacterium]|nr:hypothetical protein [Lachnospiraceae bacterium]